MIKTIRLENFRCFESLRVDQCSRINVIVGDNGSGKTALLEAVFLALCSSTEVPVRFRQQRGLEGSFSGSPRAIEDAIFGDLFFARDMARVIDIELSGDGEEARALQIARGSGPSLFDPSLGISSSATPLTFTWRDASGHTRTASPQVIAGQNFQLHGTGEDLPDFFYFPANQTVSALEAASRFSDLSRQNRASEFVKAFTTEYNWIEDFSIEVVGGSPAVYAKTKDIAQKLPIPNVSGAINRMMTLLLAMASRNRSIVLIDELENGIYYRHYVGIWKTIFTFARRFDSQMFTTTHSEEWLASLMDAAGNNVDDIALWRLERVDSKIALRQFFGTTFKAGIETGGELRG